MESLEFVSLCINVQLVRHSYTTYISVYKANDILRILFDLTVQCLLYSLLSTDIYTNFLAGEIQKAQTTPHEIIIQWEGGWDTGSS